MIFANIAVNVLFRVVFNKLQQNQFREALELQGDYRIQLQNYEESHWSYMKKCHISVFKFCVVEQEIS